MPNVIPAAAVCRRPAVRLPMLPLPRAGSLDPKQAVRLAKRERELLRAGVITHRELALLDCLLWSRRRPGQELVVASYTALCKLAHMARDTIWKGLEQLEQLGLIARIKGRVRLSWHQGGSRSLQVTSCYWLMLPAQAVAGGCHSESGGQTVNRAMEIFYQERLASDDAEAAKKALQEIAAARADVLRREWAIKRGR